MRNLIIILSLLLFPIGANSQNNISDKSKEIADILKGARESVSIENKSSVQVSSETNSSNTVKKLSTKRDKQNELPVSSNERQTEPLNQGNNYTGTVKKVIDRPIVLKKLTPDVDTQMGLTKKILWEGKPINVSMAVGKEQKIYMPEPGHFGTPKNVALPIKVDSHSSVLVITALSEFSRVRTIFYGESSGNSYLLDLSASRVKGMPYTLEVITTDGVIDKKMVIAKETRLANKLPRVGRSAYGDSGFSSEADIYQMLSRFAAQQHYAPLRVRKNPYNIAEQRVNKIAMPLLRLASNVIAVPQMSWSYSSNRNNYYVTSVLLKNTGQTDYNLTPNLVRNPLRSNGFAFVAATFQNSVLYGNKSSNKANRITMMYLISREPFNKIVSPMMVMNNYGDDDDE